ncbi:Holo-[acyl-carrier-protein] synthase, partial [Dissostichus eleginoides]
FVHQGRPCCGWGCDEGDCLSKGQVSSPSCPKPSEGLRLERVGLGDGTAEVSLGHINSRLRGIRPCISGSAGLQEVLSKLDWVHEQSCMQVEADMLAVLHVAESAIQTNTGPGLSFIEATEWLQAHWYSDPMSAPPVANPSFMGHLTLTGCTTHAPWEPVTMVTAGNISTRALATPPTPTITIAN